ncbi:MAG: hypothetical protein AAFN10_15675 [Bacteroidota bacterium]
MDLHQILKARTNRDHMVEIAEWVGEDPKRFAEVWRLVNCGEEPTAPYASWLMDFCLQLHPNHLLPYRKGAFDLLQQPLHNMIHRNIVKHLYRVEIDEEIEGELYDLAINKISNPQVEVAIRVHCMNIAWKIAEPYPELREELRLVIEGHIGDGSAGFKSRGKRILKWIEKAK